MHTRPLALAALLLALNQTVGASPGYTWNLSRDLLNAGSANPFGPEQVWTAMYDPLGLSHQPKNYRALPTHEPKFGGAPLAVWTHTQQDTLLIGALTQTHTFRNSYSDFVAQRGTPTLHPSPGMAAVLRWISPLSGVVSVTGRITDADRGCGNGVEWALDKDSLTLASGTIPNGNNSLLLHREKIDVKVGTALYFIVGANGKDNWCDSTHLDILIMGR